MRTLILLPLAAALIPSALGAEPSRPVQSADPAVLHSEIDSVTVYPSSALVTRRAPVKLMDSPQGEYVVPGLPISLDPETVRVRAEGFEVMGVEARERFVRELPTERLAELKKREAVLVSELGLLQEALGSASEGADYFAELLEKGPLKRDEAGVEGIVEAWARGSEFLLDGYREALKAKRVAAGRVDAKAQELKQLRSELASGADGRGHQVRDVFLTLEGPAGRAGELELSYLVRGASWAPSYNLRADRKLDAVELVYRAGVVQTTGEDWTDVELLLSTANPEVGAEAPALGALWLSLWDPEAGRKMWKSSRGFADDAPAAGLAMAPAESARNKDQAGSFASVLEGAGSLRYRVARRESVPSRSDSSTVLVGRALLAVEAEHYCVPAQDENVWLRGRTTNTSSWVMLPGPAAVYFGGDFVGRTHLDSVRLGEEFELDLGMDPGLTFERVELEKSSGSSGFFGSRATETRSWRLVFHAQGAVGKEPDGSTRVLVQAVLPRSSDERLKVELDHAIPPVSTAERWKRSRADEGILTWDLRVPEGLETTIEWGYELSYPEDMEVSR